MTNLSDISPATDAFREDVQASRPSVHVSLTRAGVTGVHKVIRISHGADEAIYYADIECSVDLDPAQKGVHMSRFPELFAEAIERVVAREALVVEELAEHIAAQILERQNALRSHVRIEARYPVVRETPVTQLATQEIYTLIGVAAASPQRTRRAVGVRARGLMACPCAQGMVRDRAEERLAGLGYDGDERTRILDAVPIATHNQRGEATLLVGSSAYTPAEQLIEIAERSMSAPVFELLKRPDELYVVEHAHLQPRFVEDAVRHMAAGVVDAYPELADDDLLLARQVNFETIHNHDVLAERCGSIGEVRAELRDGAHSTAAHLTLDGWLAQV
jgi:GTP cyclohydrolase-4